MTARATIVIVSYNTCDLLRSCLTALRTHASQYPVIVVDNASADGSAAMVEREFPTVRVLRNSQNLGFGAANNRALAEITTDYLFILNSDTWLDSDPLPALSRTLDVNPNAAVVGCGVRSSDGTVQRSARHFPSASQCLRNLVALPDANPNSLVDVDYVDGAAMLARTAALRGIDGFDQRFFLYFEDADLCRRLHDRGWRVLYDPVVHVVHHGGGSTRRGSRSDDRLRWEALARYASLHFGWTQYLAFWCARSLELMRQTVTGGMRWVAGGDLEARQMCISALRYLGWHPRLLRGSPPVHPSLR